MDCVARFEPLKATPITATPKRGIAQSPKRDRTQTAAEISRKLARIFKLMDTASGLRELRVKAAPAMGGPIGPAAATRT